eukprot:scaffold48710_cov67-Phaeocystis_antarctica.AAC.3
MLVGVRVLAATVLFLLPAAPAVCPTGWTSSPASTTCFLVPPERSTSLFRCLDLCKEHGGTPACIGSAAENDFVTAGLAAADGLWLGLYQNETGLGPAKGWDRCVAGDAPNYRNWHQGQPDDYQGYQQDCAWVDPGTGQWRTLACDGGVRFDSDPWRLAELSCLCARDNASAAFAEDLEALEATRVYNQRLLRQRTSIAFATAIAIALLPTLLLLGRAGWRQLRRGENAESSVAVQDAPTSPSRSSATGAARSAAVKRVLRAARASAAGRRLRVSFVMGQAGWALSVMGLTPAVMFGTGQSIEAAIGSFMWWIVMYSLGNCLLLLALFPTDARAIRVVCATAIVVYTQFGAQYLATTLAGDLTDVYGFTLAALHFATAGALAPTLRCRGDRAMQPRPALRRLWTGNRLFFLSVGVLLAGFGLERRPPPVRRPRHAPQSWPPPPPPGAHGRARHGGGGGGGGRVARRWQRPRRRARTRLEAPPLPARQPTARRGPRRQHDCAISRADAPRAHGAGGDGGGDRLSEPLVAGRGRGAWRQARGRVALGETAPGDDRRRADSLAGDASPLSLHPSHRMHARLIRAACLAPQDKACIDQNNIQQSLACLPVFLAGCQTLLVVAGPTYCARLWCVMELFTFARSDRLLYSNLGGLCPRATIEPSHALVARACASGRRPKACRNPSDSSS